LGPDAEPFANKELCNLIKSQPGFWRDLNPIDMGMQTLNLISIHMSPHILTKGPFKTTSAWSEKVEWCRKHVPGTPVTVTEDKGLTYGRMLFDDFPPYCRQWLAWRPRGIVLMLPYAYNKDFDKEFPGRVTYVTGKNWDEVEAAIKAAAERKIV